MKTFVSLKSKIEFNRVYNNKNSLANKYLIMYIIKNDLEINRIGLSVSKKVGNSVIRHRVTRLLRESIRLNEESIKTGYDFVLVARDTIKDKSFFEVESAFLHLVKLHKILISK